MSKTNSVEFLVGNENFDYTPNFSFDDNVVSFLNDFSIKLNSMKLIRDFPDLKTLSFWCRKNNIINLKRKFFDKENIRLGLGFIFHITPSNIPINFMYSLIFGLLTGNSNLVRVPSKNFDQIKIICLCINKILKKKKFSVLKKKITIVRYKKDDPEFTKKFSLLSDARLIWGGDKTINEIKKFPSKERCRDITFPDRYSISIINSDIFLKSNDLDKKKLIYNFYNDTFAVDQNACSSPHLLVWTGLKTKSAKGIFWNKLSHLVKSKYNIFEKASVEKFTMLCDDILNNTNLKEHKVYNDVIYTQQICRPTKDLQNLRGKWGYFYEYNTNDINKLFNYFNEKFQTITYFGFTKDHFKKILRRKDLNGVDRIVPVGQALDIGLIWDGYDLTKILSRIIDLK